MVRRLTLNFLNIAMAAAAIFALLSVAPLDKLIFVLNGVFIGTGVALVVSFAPLLWNALAGVRPYDRVRQMTLAWAVVWLGIFLQTSTSVYQNASADDINQMYVYALYKILFIIGAVMQQTAPDFGLGIFYGRDRKVLWTSFLIGGFVALLVFMAQEDNWLITTVKAGGLWIP